MKKIKVLIADDHSIVRAGLSSILGNVAKSGKGNAYACLTASVIS